MASELAPFVLIHGCARPLSDFTDKITAGRLFVVHPRLVGDRPAIDPRHWSITHRASGREICYAGNFRQALRLAEALTGLEGWHDNPVMMAARPGFFAEVQLTVSRNGGQFDLDGQGVLGSGWTVAR